MVADQTLRHPKSAEEIVDEQLGDDWRRMSLHSIRLAPFGVDIRDGHDVLVASGGSWMFSSDVQGDHLEWFSSAERLQWCLSRCLASVILGTVVALLELCRYLSSPAWPVCTSPDLLLRLRASEMSTRHACMSHGDAEHPMTPWHNNLHDVRRSIDGCPPPVKHSVDDLQSVPLMPQRLHLR